MGIVGVGALVILIGSNRKLDRTYSIAVRPVLVPADAAALARGKHLAETRGCADCHGADFGGKTVMANGAMGRVDGPNLTRGNGGLPPSFSTLDYIRAIRHGVNPEGRGLFLMPSTDYATLTEGDLGALIAYLKSVPPVDRPRVPLTLGPVARALLATGKIKLAAAEIDHANVRPAMVVAAVSVEYGHYVAASCTGCHGPNLSGGKIAVGPPDWPPAANLTPHAEGALARWTEADFFKALRTAKRPDGREISPVMPRAFGQLDDVEIKAVWMYLKTLPPAATGVR